MGDGTSLFMEIRVGTRKRDKITSLIELGNVPEIALEAPTTKNVTKKMKNIWLEESL